MPGQGMSVVAQSDDGESPRGHMPGHAFRRHCSKKVSHALVRPGELCALVDGVEEESALGRCSESVGVGGGCPGSLCESERV